MLNKQNSFFHRSGKENQHLVVRFPVKGKKQIKGENLQFSKEENKLHKFPQEQVTKLNLDNH